MASPDAAELSCCAPAIDPAIGSTTVIVLWLALAAAGTATYNFCWLGFHARSVPSTPNIVRFVPGGLMVKVRLPDVPPPGVGFCTATAAVPAEVRSDAGICATWLPFHTTCEVERKSVPVTVSSNAAPPTAPPGGEIEVTVGVGLGGGVMVKVSAPDMPPPGVGFCTARVAAPIEPRSDAGICAVSEVLDT